jgi:hypothetical protein
MAATATAVSGDLARASWNLRTTISEALLPAARRLHAVRAPLLCVWEQLAFTCVYDSYQNRTRTEIRWEEATPLLKASALHCNFLQSIPEASSYLPTHLLLLTPQVESITWYCVG